MDRASRSYEDAARTYCAAIAGSVGRAASRHGDQASRNGPSFPRRKWRQHVRHDAAEGASPYERRTTVHGFRSSFRTWVAEETEFPGEVAEAALAHQNPNKVERAYQRGGLLDKRRKLMNAWGIYCATDREVAKVVPLIRHTKDAC